MCFGFRGSATKLRRNKYHYREEETCAPRPGTPYAHNGHHDCHDRYNMKGESDHYSIRSPARLSHHSYHRHHHGHHGHHYYHSHHGHGHHDRYEYRGADRERYYYQPSPRSSFTTTEGNGNDGCGGYWYSYSQPTGSGPGRLLGCSGARAIVAAPVRGRSSVSELLTGAEGQRQVREQGSVVYERTTDTRSRYA